MNRFRLLAVLLLLVGISVSGLSMGCEARGEVDDDGVEAEIDDN